MEQREVNESLRRMMAIWPQELSDDTIEMWADLLERRDYTEARGVIRTLQGHSKFFPSIAEWEQVWRQRSQRKEFPALPAPAITTSEKSTGRAWLAALRESVANPSSITGKHSGSNDSSHARCDVCAALAAKVEDRSRGGAA